MMKAERQYEPGLKWYYILLIIAAAAFGSWLARYFFGS